MKVTTLLWSAKRLFAGFLFVLLSVSTWMAPAGRCAEERGEVIKLEDVRVSAGKMETVVEKIPTNIEVITRDDIEKTPGVVYVNDLLQQVPGLYAPRFQSGVANDGVFSVRGSELSAQGLRIMVNGIELNKGNGYVVLPRLPLHDVERIEIIKTASAEYGDQAVGGIINVVTRISEERLEAKVGAALGSYDYGAAYTVVNGSNEKWEYFVDFGFSRSEGYQDETSYDPNNFYTRLAYAIDDTMDMEFHGSYMDSEGVWPEELTQEEFDEDPTQCPGTADPFENEYKLGALVFKKRFGDDELKFKLIGKDEYVTMDFGLDFVFDEWEIYPALTYAWRSGVGSMNNHLVLGTEYREHELTTRLFTLTNGVRDTKLRDTVREDTSFAAFAINELSVTDALTITAGLRFDSYEQDQTGRVSSANNVKQSDEAISPKLGATYTVNEALNIFAGFNSGYKSPARLPGAAYSPGLDPEKVHSYEAGVRGRPLPWLSGSVTGFINQYKDKWIQTGTGPTDPYENAGETETTGIELSLGADFQSGFFADLSYTYQEAEFEDYLKSGVRLDGKKIPNVPEQLLGIRVGYDHSFLGQITLTGDYVGDRYFDEANTLDGDDYWIMGASYKKTFVHWDPGVSFFVDVKNITDEEEVVRGGGSPGSESLVPIYGRSFLFGLELLF
jgi:iron complex outermembrane receptor protein